MVTMVSFILSFLLTIGGSPLQVSGSISPVNSVNNYNSIGEYYINTVPGSKTLGNAYSQYGNPRTLYINANSKTASRPKLKIDLRRAFLEGLESRNRIRSELFLNRKMLLMCYKDSMNLYQAFNMNPVNFTDPMGKNVLVEVTPGGSTSKHLDVGEYYLLLIENGYSVSAALDDISNNTEYSKYFLDGSLVNSIKSAISEREFRKKYPNATIEFGGTHSPYGLIQRDGTVIPYDYRSELDKNYERVGNAIALTAIFVVPTLTQRSSGTGSMSYADDALNVVDDIEGQYVLSQSDMYSLRAGGNPNAAARRYVQESGGYIDPLTNKFVPTTETLPADHMIADKIIRNLKNFDKLTKTEQSKVLNYLKNFQPLPKTFNSSKGSKFLSEWLTYKGQPLHPAYIQRNMEIEKKLLNDLQSLINSILARKGG